MFIQPFFRILVVLIASAAPVCAANWDWRFADPNSILIAGSSVSPTAANPIAYFFIQRWTPLGRLPKSFQPLLSAIQTVTYSAVSSRQEVTVLTGSFDFAAIRSAAGAVGMTSQSYNGVEVLASTKANWDQIALISTNTLVFGVQATLHAAIDRWKMNPSQSATNTLIQQSATFASGWDLFSIGSGSSTLQALLGAKSVSTYLANRAPTLGAQLRAATGFTFRGNVNNTFRLELNITEPDSSTASSAATTLAAVPGQIKAKGPGASDLLAALNAYTSVTSVGPIVEIVIDPGLYTLTTVVTPPQSGTLSPSTSGLFFAANSSVTLTATPAACYGAPTWSANAPGGVVLMSGTQTVTATFPTASAASVASGVTATPGALRLNHATGRYQQLIALKNTGSALANVSVIFDNLTPGVSLYNPDGTSTCAPAGGPYRNVSTLPAGTTSLTVEFTVADPSIAIQYSARVVAGAGTR